jgi:hypothetical protein
MLLGRNDSVGKYGLMSDLTYDDRIVSPIQRQLHRIRRLGALLAAALVAALVASIEIEQCRTLPGAFSNGFSSGFDVSRKVCRQATMGRAAVDGLHRFIAIAPR